ncbi:MAG TPA: SIS domain-containing protein [Candidatus Acidoferrales bacterium]|nr:SIS domain-containing protein [Candidatus Acidoferrales bacterium]
MATNGESAGASRIALDYLEAFTALLRQIDPQAIGRVVRHLRDAVARGATIYVAGNGGSAATASHWVNDLGKATKRPGQAPLRVMSLSDNVCWLTALANDEGYERVFSGQLENFARAGDVLVVISASGNSANLVKAVELARERGLLTIGFLGFDGGSLISKVDDCIWVATEKGAYGLVESAHSLLCHILTTCLMQLPRAAAKGPGSPARLAPAGPTGRRL